MMKRRHFLAALTRVGAIAGASVGTAGLAVSTVATVEPRYSQGSIDPDMGIGERIPSSQLPFDDTVTLEIGYRLIPIVLREYGDAQAYLNELKEMKSVCSHLLDFPMPNTHTKDNLEFSPDQYRFCHLGRVVARGELRWDRKLALWISKKRLTNPGGGGASGAGSAPKTHALGDTVAKRPHGPPYERAPDLGLAGIEAFWIPPEYEAQASSDGCMVGNPSDLIWAHWLTVLLTAPMRS